MCNNPSRDKGFSLVEILIGIVLLAIALLAIAGMQITSIKGNSFSSNMTQATFYGQDGLETLRSFPIPGGVWPASLSVGQHNFGQTPDDGDSLIPGTQYSRAYTVTQHPTIATMRIIQVTVNWTDKTNHTFSFSMSRTSVH
jgi:prepilin-type N-terminal cleavage/methylation domain-containing protein